MEGWKDINREKSAHDTKVVLDDEKERTSQSRSLQRVKK